MVLQALKVSPLERGSGRPGSPSPGSLRHWTEILLRSLKHITFRNSDVGYCFTQERAGGGFFISFADGDNRERQSVPTISYFSDNKKEHKTSATWVWSILLGLPQCTHGLVYRKNWHVQIKLKILLRYPGGTPSYRLYRYVRHQMVWFFSSFGHK